MTANYKLLNNQGAKMANYYSEDVEKDTVYRQEYVDGIKEYLKRAKERADEKRADYISPEKYKHNPEKYRRDFINQLGFPLTEKRETPVLKEKKFVVNDGNVNIYRMQFTFFGYLNVYGLYLEQVKANERTPFVIGLHGGDGTPEVVSSIHFKSANYHHLVRRITDKGASVFAPQLLLWKTSDYGNEYDRNKTDGKLRQLGGSMTALEVYLMQCCIDYFIENENISADRIGVAGLSYGGMYALHLAAADTRIKACYSCSWVADCFRYSLSDWSYFNAQKRFTTAETAGIIAPRTLVVAMGDKDNLFDSKLTVAESEKIKKYYDVFGESDKFKYFIFEGNHEADKSDEEIEMLLNAIISNK